MDKNKKTVTIIFSILLILTLCFIFSHSFSSKEASAQESLSILQFIQPILDRLFGEGKITNHIIRKFAHFFEFSVLGMELGVLVFSIDKNKTVYAVLFGLLAALTDETIQIFTNRGSQVQDVWLDFSGVCFGILFASLISFIFIKYSLRKRTSANTHIKE